MMCSELIVYTVITIIIFISIYQEFASQRYEDSNDNILIQPDEGYDDKQQTNAQLISN